MAATAKQEARLSDDQLVELLNLTRGADSVELKLTVPLAGQRAAAEALGLDPLDGQIRLVCFFDTPELALYSHGLVVRGRRVQGATTTPSSSCGPWCPTSSRTSCASRPTSWSRSTRCPAASCAPARSRACRASAPCSDVVRGDAPLRKLLSKDQRALYAANAPEGIELDDLSLLGPIFVLKLKGVPPGAGRKLVVELWLYPGRQPDPRALDEVRAERGAAGGGGDPRVPRPSAAWICWRAADQDAHRSRVLRRAPLARPVRHPPRVTPAHPRRIDAARVSGVGYEIRVRDG